MLSLRHTFGFRATPGGARQNVQFIDEHLVAYPCGHNVCLLNTETRDQQFIHGSTQPFQSLSITAISFSSARRIIAVAERADPVAFVTFYDAGSLRRRKLLHWADLGSQEVHSISFSNDERYCLTQGGAPEWNLVLWSTDKAIKVLSSVKISSTTETLGYVVADFCPTDSSMVCVSGNGMLRIFRVVENQFRALSLNMKRDTQRYTCHAWLWDEKLVVGTESGEILLLENLEMKHVLYPSAADVSAPPIHSLHVHSKGFLAAGVDGILRIFEKSEEVKEQYQCVKQHAITEIDTCPGITTIAISPAEETVICATDNQQLLSFPLGSGDLAKEEVQKFETVLASFHAPDAAGRAHVSCMDSCIWKPVVVTAGADRTVRVWNYEERSLEICHKCSDEPTACAMHPSGFSIAVGFAEKLVLFSALIDGLEPVRELGVRACSAIRYASGGQWFAAASNTNIAVFDSYAFSQLITLRGHNQRICDLQWIHGDRRLISAGHDGSAICWNVLEANKEAEYQNTRDMYMAAACNDDIRRVMLLTTEGNLKTVDLTSQEVTNDVVFPTFPSCSVLSRGGSHMFVGTKGMDAPGAIMIYPVIPEVTSQPVATSLFHGSRVMCVATSFDGRLLFSADADGCVCISEITGDAVRGAGASGASAMGVQAAAGAAASVTGAGPGVGMSSLSGSRTGSVGGSTGAGGLGLLGAASLQSDRDRDMAHDYVEEVMVNRSAMLEKIARMEELRQRVDELIMDNEYQLRVKEIEYRDKLKEVSGKFTGELETQTRKYQGLLEDKQTLEMEYEDRVKELDGQHRNETEDLEKQYTGKINTEIARYQELSLEKEEMHRSWDEENQELIDSHAKYLQRLTEEYDNKVEEEQQLQKTLQEEKEKFTVQFERTKMHIEEDAEQEINELKMKFDAKLASEEEASMHLMFEHGVMKKSLRLLSGDAERQKDEIRRLNERQDRLSETIRGLEKDIQSHKKEIREREETIGDKERRIFDLKKKNQELEKFKFVLDYKIKELKRQIEPRENEISDMRRQIEEMDLELEQYHKSNSALDLMIGELRLKMEGLQREGDAQDTQISQNTELLDRVRRDVKGLGNYLDDFGQLKQRVVAMHKVYAHEDVGAAMEAAAGAGAAGDVQDMYNRQREHLERNMDALRRNLETDANIARKDLSKMMRENVLLTSEMNDLRRNARMLHKQQAAIDHTLRTGGTMETYRALLGGRQGTTDGGGAGSAGGSAAVSGSATPAIAPAPPQTGGGPGSARQASRAATSRSRAGTAGDGDSARASITRGSSRGGAQDFGEAWREIRIQVEHMASMEEQITRMCAALNLDPAAVMAELPPAATVGFT